MGFLCKTFGHKWERLLNECSRRCRVCGATETIEHQWQQIEGQCAEKCKVCGKRRNIECTFDGCKCVRCGNEKHSYVYVDGDATDLQLCTKCGKYYLSSHLRTRNTEEGILDMFETLISLHGDILPQIISTDHIYNVIAYDVIAAKRQQLSEKEERILILLYEHGVQIKAIDYIRARIEERKKSRYLSDDEIRRQEYDTNADEGIFHGGVRGDK